MVVNYNYYKKLIIDGSKIDEDLIHFPVPIILSSGTCSDIFEEVGSDYSKIAVTLDDKSTQLYCEVEQWDSLAERGLLWVSRDTWTVASGTDTDIYLFFDANASDNTEFVGTPGNRTEVWNSDFAAVYTMAQDPSGGADCIIDSSGNGNHGTPGGSMTSGDLVDGQIGKAIDFDGNDSIQISDDAILDISGDKITIKFSIWPAASQNQEWCGVVTKEKSYGVYYNSVDNAAHAWVAVNDIFTPKITTSSNSVPSEQWTHIVVEYDGSNITIYTDNSQTGQVSKSGNIDVDNYDLYIGQHEVNGEYFQGKINDICLLSAVPSAAWIKADYHAQTDNLLTFTGTKESYKFSGVIKKEGVLDEGAEVVLMYYPTYEVLDSGYTTNSGTFNLSSVLDGLHYIISFPPSGSSYNAQILYGFDTTVSG
jgi:hypothetical protein